MSVLVTGGTGFVGGAIVRALVKQGDNVRVLARRTSKTEHLKAMGVEIAYGDILDEESISAALQGCNILYHAAALYDFWGLDEQVLMRTEVEGTRDTLEAALKVGVEKVVYTSTAVTIGERKGEVGTEATQHRGYFLSKYERAKFEAEQVATSYLDKSLPIIMVNPAGVYGPGDFKPTGRAIIDFLNGRILGLFGGSSSFVYIDDVGMGHALAARKGKVGERYILCGNIVTMHELARMLCRLSDAKMPPTVPAFLAGMNASLGQMVSRFTRRPPILSRETFRVISHGFQVDGAKASRELGIVYASLEEGLRKTIAWYWEQGLLKRKPACL
ncbi:MAG TPA: NAD-dependent epimerase/dehydratase family protein [Thermodesulfobacteriota bacterium]|nr:NAD-dependent epimerase/dehydratase family protein [Thermodesulfobacteriota bacterium]